MLAEKIARGGASQIGLACNAAWSIGLSADGRGLVHDSESPVTHPSVAPVIRATAGTLSLVLILDAIIPSSIITANL